MLRRASGRFTYITDDASGRRGTIFLYWNINANIYMTSTVAYAERHSPLIVAIGFKRNELYIPRVLALVLVVKFSHCRVSENPHLLLINRSSQLYHHLPGVRTSGPNESPSAIFVYTRLPIKSAFLNIGKAVL